MALRWFGRGLPQPTQDIPAADYLHSLIHAIAPYLEYQEWKGLRRGLGLAKVVFLGDNMPLPEAILRLAASLSTVQNVEILHPEIREIQQRPKETSLRFRLPLRWSMNESWEMGKVAAEVELTMARGSFGGRLRTLAIPRISPVVRLAAGTDDGANQAKDSLRLVVCTVATRRKPGLADLEQSCARVGVPLRIYGKGAPWRGSTYNKLKGLYWFLQRNRTQFDYVLFTDAYDSVLVAGIDRILERYLAIGTPILFSAEANCFPAAPGQRLTDYPPSPTRYRFLNAGGLIAHIPYLLQAMTALEVPEVADFQSDQGWWAGVYVRRKADIALDHQCQVFQCLHSARSDLAIQSPAFVNRLTGSTPCVIHGNGHSRIRPFADHLLGRRASLVGFFEDRLWYR
jgi:hypothetical protein